MTFFLLFYLYMNQADNNKDGGLPAIEGLLEKLITNLMDKREARRERENHREESYRKGLCQPPRRYYAPMIYFNISTMSAGPI